MVKDEILSIEEWALSILQKRRSFASFALGFEYSNDILGSEELGVKTDGRQWVSCRNLV
jgi:hypothetical protein